MTLQDLYSAVSQLGFEDSLGDSGNDGFIYAVNRALEEVNSLRPRCRRVDKKYSKLKAACYSANISMSIVSSLSPVLFLIFRTLYGISYSKLGLLVLISFITQLGVDLIFSFFSHKFNIPTTLRINPLLTIIGLII